MTPLDFLTLLWQHKPADLYILIWSLEGKQSQWFQQVSTAADFVNKAHGKNIYVGVGLSRRDFGPTSRCLSDEIAGLAGFWADFDLKSEAHSKKALPATIEQALTIVPAALPPTIVVATGNGVHGWWLFREPWIFQSDEERKKASVLAARFQTMLLYNSHQHGWAFDRLSDLARVLRIAGTINAKNPDDLKEVIVHSFGNLRYEPGEFERYLDERGIADPAVEERKAKRWIEPYSCESLVINPDAAMPDDMIARWMETDLRFRNTWTRQRHDLSDQSQSGYDIALACFGVSAGLDEQQIADLIVQHRRKHGQQRPKSLDYYRRTLSKAFARSETHVDNTAPADSWAIEAAEDGRTTTAKLCDQISRALGTEVLRLIKVSGKDPIYFMDLAEGRIEIPDVGKLTSQKFIRLTIAGKTGRLIPNFKQKRWEELAQMMLNACVVQEGTEDLELEGSARIQIAQYLSEVRVWASLKSEPLQDQRKPLIVDGQIAICSSHLQLYMSKMTQQQVSVKAVAAMIAALGAQAVRVRSGTFKEQGRWLLPKEEFDIKNYPTQSEDYHHA